MQIWRWNIEWKDEAGVHAIGWTVRARTATAALRKAAIGLPRALDTAGLTLAGAKPGSVRLDLLWTEVLS